MKRSAPHLAATAAEFLRFAALMFLAEGLGSLKAEGGADRLFRYAAAPQLLLPAAFFFLWLDSGRYAQYRPLLLLGKVLCLVSLLPVALLALALLRSPAAQARDPGLMAGLAGFVAVVDLASLAVLLLARPAGGGDSARAPSGQGTAGQSPDTIERVEV